MKGKSALDFPLEWPAVLLSRKRCAIRRLNDELINVCGQSLKLFFYRIEELLNCEICTRRFLQVGVHATLLKS